MKRTRLNPRTDKKRFSRTTKVHSSNTVTSVMRGGIRK